MISNTFDDKKLLESLGWYKANSLAMCLNAKGEFIPWYCYGVTEFISERLSNEISIFEYGCGFSTLFYAKRAKSVISVETRQEWLTKITTIAEQNEFDRNYNINLIDKPNFAESIVGLSKGNFFDVIVIDSEDRIKCLEISQKCLASAGVIIFDNSDKKQYNEIFLYMKERSFKYIKFSGIKPLSEKTSETTIFYRNDNVFGI